MNRDEIAVSLIPTMFTGAINLGSFTEEERKEIFDLTAKIAYEITDAFIRASKEPPKTN